MDMGNVGVRAEQGHYNNVEIYGDWNGQCVSWFVLWCFKGDGHFAPIVGTWNRAGVPMGQGDMTMTCGLG